MPTNKNALARIAFLDTLLADRHHYYNLDDLTEKCNERLEKIGVSTVTRRCIEKDIDFIEGASFGGNINKETVNGKYCLRYADPSFSIFTKKLSDDEKNLLQEVLSTIGQFEGLEDFEWIDDLKQRLDVEERPKIISFSNNPFLKNSNLLGLIFNYISHKNVVRVCYSAFVKAKAGIEFHPYLLKQYNDRWYLIGAADSDGKILTLALDRITNIEPVANKEFVEPDEDFAERFDDIVGVTLIDGKPLEHIVFWVSDVSKDYVESKPIHGSQKLISNDEDLRRQYPKLVGGRFFSIDCIPNYELIRELTSFGRELLVLKPEDVRAKVLEWFSKAAERYLECQ
ncbi:MAG: WYL domain-containing protein [Bacteroidales bacterium]|nr:WYL domain-containing protein [Bacteroidales bacterium]